MEIPEGAKVPSDHQQSQLVKPETHPDGWSLLRPSVDLEFWERSEIMATVATIKQRGDILTLTTANIRAIAGLGKLFQESLAVDSNAFKAWLNSGEYADQVKRLVELAGAYSASLGEADSSEN